MLDLLEQGLQDSFVAGDVEPLNSLFDEEDSPHVADPGLDDHEKDLASAADSFCPLLFTPFSHELLNQLEVTFSLRRFDIIRIVLLPVKELVHGLDCTTCRPTLIN